MAYKTILVHVDLSAHAPARIRLAALLARAEGAHLVGAAMTGVARLVRHLYADNVAELTRSVPLELLDRLKDQACQALERFNLLARQYGVASFEPRLSDDDPRDGLAVFSRWADLVVLSQTDPAHMADVARDLPEHVVLHSSRPVLLVPYAGRYADLDGKALVAWDGSFEASRALGAALPLLRRASEVTIAQFDKGEPGELAAQAPYLIEWLGRHGIRAAIHERGTEIDAGDALLSFAADLQADLIVMGGYGHARFRELLLGGVTRTVLESMTMPVLMAH
jgi:nucleotide-binding universal stress UspA family protein